MQNGHGGRAPARDKSTRTSVQHPHCVDPSLDLARHWLTLIDFYHLLYVRRFNLDNQQLAEDLILRYIKQVACIYGPGAVRPMEHYIFHLPRQLRELGAVDQFWTYIFERLNRVQKQWHTNKRGHGQNEMQTMRAALRMQGIEALLEKHAALPSDEPDARINPAVQVLARLGRRDDRQGTAQAQALAGTHDPDDARQAMHFSLASLSAIGQPVTLDDQDVALVITALRRVNAAHAYVGPRADPQQRRQVLRVAYAYATCRYGVARTMRASDQPHGDARLIFAREALPGYASEPQYVPGEVQRILRIEIFDGATQATTSEIILQIHPWIHIPCALPPPLDEPQFKRIAPSTWRPQRAESLSLAMVHLTDVLSPAWMHPWSTSAPCEFAVVLLRRDTVLPTQPHGEPLGHEFDDHFARTRRPALTEEELAQARARPDTDNDPAPADAEDAENMEEDDPGDIEEEVDDNDEAEM